MKACQHGHLQSLEALSAKGLALQGTRPHILIKKCDNLKDQLLPNYYLIIRNSVLVGQLVKH